MTLLLATVSASALDVGAPAPELKVAQWLQGDAVSLDHADAKTIYVLDFWATWCGPCVQTIPHLNAITEQYKDKNVVVIGLSGEDEATVKPFAAKMGIQYRLALDAESATTNAYIGEQGTIPTAFIVRGGRILWSGHPLDDLDTVLEQTVAGRYTVENAQAAAAAFKTLQEAARKRDVMGVYEAADELIRLEPWNYRHVQLKVRVLRSRNGTSEILRLRRLAAGNFAGHARNLNDLAWDIATDSEFPARDLPLALECARESVRLTGGKAASSLDTLARVYYEMCRIDEAIATQKLAIPAAADEDEKDASEAVLKYYETVKTLQSEPAPAR